MNSSFAIHNYFFSRTNTKLHKVSCKNCIVLLSPPVWGAWIEIVLFQRTTSLEKRRLPYGGRGLKYMNNTPFIFKPTESPPVWGAWIEMLCLMSSCHLQQVASRMGAWIEIVIYLLYVRHLMMSPPVWGAWIEIKIITIK